MKIGIGLPNPIPGVGGRLLVDWAKQAEERGFSTLATIDRIAYPSYESLITLAAAAAVTERIGLLTNILLAPTRNPVLLAKEAAGVDRISEGRLTLGLGVGGREDDFTAAQQDFKTRGKRWDSDLDIMHRAWRGEPVEGSPQPVTPTPTHGGAVPILIGGTSEQAIARTVQWGAGWTGGGGGPDQTGPVVEKVRAAWREAGREGEPKLVALSYFSSSDAQASSVAYIKDYYSFMGPMADAMANWLPRTPEALRGLVDQFSGIGMTELIFVPTVASLDELNFLAEAVL